MKFDTQHQKHVPSYTLKFCKVLEKINQPNIVVSMATLHKISKNAITRLLEASNRYQSNLNRVKLIEYVRNDDPRPSHKPGVACAIHLSRHLQCSEANGATLPLDVLSDQ